MCFVASATTTKLPTKLTTILIIWCSTYPNTCLISNKTNTQKRNCNKTVNPIRFAPHKYKLPSSCHAEPCVLETNSSHLWANLLWNADCELKVEIWGCWAYGIWNIGGRFTVSLAYVKRWYQYYSSIDHSKDNGHLSIAYGSGRKLLVENVTTAVSVRV